MSYQKGALLALAFFLFTFSAGGIAESEATFENSKVAKFSKKKWKVIDGFRSVKFGMDEKQVLRAIAKDFKFSKKKVKREAHPKEKTTALFIHVPTLAEVGGPAHIAYILGYKSKRLIQVNIDWGIEVSKDLPSQEVIDVANLLAKFFNEKRYQKKGYLFNQRINDTTIIVFRGKDKKGRMILLRLKTLKDKAGEHKKQARKNLSLKLSYIKEPENPDLFKAKTK
jgi:hypothetical protein